MLKDLSKLQYRLLPGRFNPGFAGTPLYNQAYRFWLDFWNIVLKENGSQEGLNPHDFLKADLISLLTVEDEIVALLIHSLLNLEQESIDYHPYLAQAEEREFLTSLRNLSCRSAMTMEYLTVSRNWRKSKIGFSLAPVIVGLGYQTQRALQFDASLGRCRQDLHVNQLMSEVGGVTLKTNVMMHNTPTAFCTVFLDRMKTHPDPGTQSFINRLWQDRSDLSGQTTIHEPPVTVDVA